MLLASGQRKVSTFTTIVLFLAAVTVLFMGIVGGLAIYRSFARARSSHFHGFCGVPYDASAVSNQALLQSDLEYRMRGDASDEVLL